MITAVRRTDERPFKMLYPHTIDPLPRDEEQRLIRRYQQDGDLDARDTLIHANLRFIFTIAQEYENRFLPLDDLISEGVDGFIEALNRFDASRGLKLISFAVWWLRQRMKKALGENKTVRPPLTVVMDSYAVDRKSEKLMQQMGRYPTLHEIAANAGISEDRALRGQTIRNASCSLDSPLETDEHDPISYLGQYEQETFPAADDELHHAELREMIDGILDTLESRDKWILEKYFGLAGEEPMTLEEIGDELNITRERVRQLRNRALEELKEVMIDRAKETKWKRIQEAAG
jgi:RNA polymerase primary sigma factor